MKPRVFIGSSVEAKTLCGAIQHGLQYSAWASAWYQIFPLASGTLEALLGNFTENDFAVLVLSPDDVADIRGTTFAVARDNVLFEAGLFMGMHGKKRVFLVTPQSTPSFHIPSDLLGITTATYDPAHALKDPQSAMGAAVFAIEQAIKKTTALQEDIHITTSVAFNLTVNWKLKFRMHISNRHSVSVSIRSDKYIFAPNTSHSIEDSVLRDGIHRPAFLLEHKGPELANDRYSDECLLKPGQTILAWVDYDEKIGEATFNQLSSAGKLGTWQYRCVWHHSTPIALTYERQF